jgi:hypothetical protein
MQPTDTEGEPSMSSHPIHKSIVVTLAALVAAIAASTAQAYTQPETRPVLRSAHIVSTAPALRALHMRSEALNVRYGLGSGSTSAALRALNIRGEGLNARYVDAPVATTVESPFSWGDFGIGAGAALGGIALLLLAVAAGRPRRTRTVVA